MARKRKPRVIHVSGRRWFQTTYGNTYHSYNIYIDGEHVHYMPFAYGYGEQYLYNAFQWLRENNKLWGKSKSFTSGPSETPWRYCQRYNIKLVYEVTDVTRKKDL